MRFTGAFLAASLALPTAATAEQSITIRGGLAVSPDQYPYAVATDAGPPTIDDIAESPYGHGGLLSFTYSRSDVFGGYGLEASLSAMQLFGEDTVGEPAPGTAACAPSIYDVFTLSHGNCMDGAEVSNTATAIQGRALASRRVSASGTEVLAGLGVLSFENSIDGMMIYPFEASDQERRNSFLGAGLVVGARHTMPISATWTLGAEAFGGVYRGDREVSIRDDYVGTIGILDQSETVTVYSLDLAVSMERDATLFGRNGSLAFGVAYTGIYDAVDTANYNANVFGTGVDSPTGSIEDDFNAVSLFVGFTIPF